MAYYITEACGGCTLCARNCPVQAITGTLKEHHTINDKRCVSCGVCGKVCAKGAVTDDKGKVVEKVPKAQWKQPFIIEDLCSACSMCVDICRFGCLQISPPKQKLDIQVYSYLKEPKKCVGCALCEEICPLHAIEMREVTV